MQKDFNFVLNDQTIANLMPSKERHDFPVEHGPQQGPDGWLYILTDESNGKLMRLVPK